MDLIIFWILKTIKNKKNTVLYFFPFLIKEIYINSHFEMIVIIDKERNLFQGIRFTPGLSIKHFLKIYI